MFRQWATQVRSGILNALGSLKDHPRNVAFGDLHSVLKDSVVESAQVVKLSARCSSLSFHLQKETLAYLHLAFEDSAAFSQVERSFAAE